MLRKLYAVGVETLCLDYSLHALIGSQQTEPEVYIETYTVKINEYKQSIFGLVT